MQSIALVLTTKNKETKHHVHPKHKRETEKTAIGNRSTSTPKRSTSWTKNYAEKDLQKKTQ